MKSLKNCSLLISVSVFFYLKIKSTRTAIIPASAYALGLVLDKSARLSAFGRPVAAPLTFASRTLGRIIPYFV